MSDITPHWVPKAWGSEHWIVNSPQYCGKILHLSAGHRCSLHMHPVKDETFYVTSGIVELELGPSPDKARSNPISLGVGQSMRIVPGMWHRFSSRTGAIIAEFSTHHDDADVVRDEPSGRMDDVTAL